MEHLKIPLNDQEEAILQLMKTIHHLEIENERLKEHLKKILLGEHGHEVCITND